MRKLLLFCFFILSGTVSKASIYDYIRHLIAELPKYSHQNLGLSDEVKAMSENVYAVDKDGMPTDLVGINHYYFSSMGHLEKLVMTDSYGEFEILYDYDYSIGNGRVKNIYMGEDILGHSYDDMGRLEKQTFTFGNGDKEDYHFTYVDGYNLSEIQGPKDTVQFFYRDGMIVRKQVGAVHYNYLYNSYRELRGIQPSNDLRAISNLLFLKDLEGNMLVERKKGGEGEPYIKVRSLTMKDGKIYNPYEDIDKLKEDLESKNHRMLLDKGFYFKDPVENPKKLDWEKTGENSFVLSFEGQKIVNYTSLTVGKFIVIYDPKDGNTYSIYDLPKWKNGFKGISRQIAAKGDFLWYKTGNSFELIRDGVKYTGQTKTEYSANKIDMRMVNQTTKDVYLLRNYKNAWRNEIHRAQPRGYKEK